MSDWAEAKSADGRTYYWNKRTKQTSWTKPEDSDSPATSTPAAPASAAPATGADWAEAKAPDGRTYWFNKATRETTWTKPASLPPTQPSQPNGRPEFVAGGGGLRDLGRHGFDDRVSRREDRNHNLPQKPSFDGPRGGGGGMPWEARQENTGYRGALAKTDEPEYGTKEQAEEAFFKLMRRNNISADTKWEDALKLVIRDREYRAIKDAKDRKQAFEKYCRQAREQEAVKAKERKARLREDFRNMLSTHDDIKPYTRWKTARPLIEREAAFKSVGNDDERKVMFHEYLAELKKQYIENEARRRKVAKHELDSMMKALIIDPEIRWVDAEDMVINNGRFLTDDTFKGMHKVDVFEAFEKHMKTLERINNDALQHEKQLRARRQRQARDGFKILLKQKQQEGLITALTQWQDLHPSIATDERYIAYLGMSGSDPLDLFWDVIEEEESRLKDKTNDALDVLEDRRFELTLETPLQEFVDLMSDDKRTSALTQADMHMIFEKLLKKIKRRQEHTKQSAERQQKLLVDHLRLAIKKLEPAVRPEDTYEDVAKRLATQRDFVEAEEDTRRIAYDKYMKRLKDKDEQDRDRRRRDRPRSRSVARSARGGHRRDDRERERDRTRRHRTRTPEVDAYEADRRKAQEARERSYNRKASFGLTPPPRERRDDRYERDHRTDRRPSVSFYERERRERELERERSYVSRADPRDKGRTLDYGDDDAVGSVSRPGSIRKRRESDVSMDSRRETKRTRRDRSTEHESLLKDDPPALQSGSEEGEIEEI